MKLRSWWLLGAMLVGCAGVEPTVPTLQGKQMARLSFRQGEGTCDEMPRVIEQPLGFREDGTVGSPVPGFLDCRAEYRVRDRRGLQTWPWYLTCQMAFVGRFEGGGWFMDRFNSAHGLMEFRGDWAGCTWAEYSIVLTEME